jgi:hypothetical protein
VLEVRVRARDEGRPASVRTPSLDLSTPKPAPARAAAHAAAVRELARVLLLADTGGLRLP